MTSADVNIATFELMESEVRMYCREAPAVFSTAIADELRAEDGRKFIDFFSGAGALNYGHNDPKMKAAIISYLQADGISHGLDLYTSSKRNFLESLQRVIFGPRSLDFKVQFSGPTGADANEAALKLARKVTGRRHVVAFNGGYHGMTVGALSVSGARRIREAGGPLLFEVTFVPYESGPYGPFDSIDYLNRMVEDSGSGVELPAAVILESVQINAGVHPATRDWLQRLRQWTQHHGILMICDEVQTGCGRTGPFFAFEDAGIVPDIVTCAKSISGYGLPLALVLLKRELDVWEPGEHTGTFRGNQLAFVSGSVALNYWEDSSFKERIATNAATLKSALAVIDQSNIVKDCRVKGMLAGIDFGLGNENLAREVQVMCFEQGLVLERCGPRGEVVKLMPPINISTDRLEMGVAVVLACTEKISASLHS